MAGEHEATVREAFKRFNARDFDSLPAITHPDVEIATETSRFAGEAYHGHEGLRQWIAESFESFDEMVLVLDEVEERGPDRVFAVGTAHIRGRESGANVDLPCAWIVDFDGTLIRRFETFLNRVEEGRRAAESGP
jgi:ketosteroid isomerase-like protein